MTAPDPNYLKNEQYKDSSRLEARARLHADYSRNPHGWFEWMFDLYHLPEQARILELGAGPGWLWLKNWQRIPAGWHITVSDFSGGMVDELRTNLARIPRPFAFEQIDVQEIAFPDQTFDTVIANQMLYHVPNRPKAIAEMRRVLKSGGTLFTGTNGDHHLREMHLLMAQFGFVRNEYLGGFIPVKGYTLENAPEQLQAAFQEVDVHRYDDAIDLTDSQPLIDYISSFRVDPNTEQLAALQTFVEGVITRDGHYVITKDMGVVIAR